MAKMKPSEFAINMYCSILGILTQEYLNSPETLNLFKRGGPNIYFILRRPRISFDPQTFAAGTEFIEIDYKIQIKDKFETRHLKIPNGLDTSDISIRSEYPYTEFAIIDNTSRIELSRGDVSLFLNQFYFYLENPDFLDFEVLYIGQAYGDGTRTALDRLPSHSTLQKIYFESIKRNPDSEIYIGLANFDQLNIMTLDGQEDFTEDELAADEQRMIKIHNKLNYEGINPQQRVTFTEAALIKYFQPQYNKEYKDSFPNSNHS
ncbi:hypothetical protein [Chitinophaga sp. W3I9]|uniref:hypothetical protein n=1 Tax=Chitinophaga sp. W3I9 TaxID=3373924 RepID=UPI003D2505AD